MLIIEPYISSKYRDLVLKLHPVKYIKWLLALTGLIYIGIEANNRNDFFIFLSASRDFFNGADIYTTSYVDGYHYFYSTFFCILLLPFTKMALYTANFLWLGFNLILLYRIFWLITGFLDLKNTAKKIQYLIIACSFIFVLRFIRDNFHVAQLTTFILFLTLEGIFQVQQGNKKTGAFLLALGINIKLLPLVLLPWLIWRKELEASAWCVFFYALLLFFPALITGNQHNLFLISEWWKLVNPMKPSHILDVEERSFHGLSTLLSTLLMEKVPDIYALPVKRNIANITEQQLGFVVNAVRLFFAAFTLYFTGLKPFRTGFSKLKTYREIAYVTLVIPLLFPHQQHYAFLFVLPAAAYLFHYLFTNQTGISKLKKRTLLSMLLCSYLCFNLSILLGNFIPYYEHFKIVTYGALLMIPLLAVCKPAGEQARMDSPKKKQAVL
jgi:hypothetical protein